MTSPDLDLHDPNTECGAWRKAPRIIGGPAHSHVCQRPIEHRETEDVDHLCACGHTW